MKAFHQRGGSQLLAPLRRGRSVVVCCALAVTTFVLVVGGCSRTKYRRAADQEAYGLIESRESDPLWTLPNRPVEPDTASRMYLGCEDDCGPKPPDDFAAHRYMCRPDDKDIHYYRKIGARANVENPIWLDYLPRDDDGKVQLNHPLAIDLALLHSREYQSAYEDVYLSALVLSGNRFEFDCQWFGGTGLDYDATGRDLGGNQVLTLSDRFGFQRNLAGGGQFATEILNGLSWNFAGGSVQSGSAAIIAGFTQPLLRGAYRHVRLENLTQAERNLLYEVREFARFRRQFYVGITEQYLGLLTQEQAIRNTRTNVENLRQNLVEHEFYSALKIVSQVQVDQVFQEYQNGRRSLLTNEQNLITLQDQLKFTLGLPAWIEFDVDQSLLEPFELVKPELEQLQNEAQKLYEALVQFLPPEHAPPELLRSYYERYVELRQQTAGFLPEVEQELEQWIDRLENTDQSLFSDDDKLDFDQQQELAGRIRESLRDLRENLETRSRYNRSLLAKLIEYEQNPPNESQQSQEKTLREILESKDSFEDVTLEDLLPNETDDTAIAAWKALEEAIGSRLREEIAELYVAQTQVRLFLIDIKPLNISSETAISFAHRNRLDLMNDKAQVVDAFRRVEVAADQLESELNVNAGIALGSDVNSNSPFKLDSANNRYTAGVQFDGPLNRLNERNFYRASQIAYQQASRDFLASKDQIANDVRRILRRLELSRLNFQIARQQVVAATRQVDQAQIDLRRSTQADSNLTIVLLQALSGMLDAKNSLILNWVEYRIQKMRLFEALEMLYLDDNGQWLNQDDGLTMIEGYQAIDPEYFPPQWIATQDTNDSDEDGLIETEPLPENILLPVLEGVAPAELLPPVQGAEQGLDDNGDGNENP